MAFGTAYLDDPARVDSGERVDSSNDLVLSAQTFENALVVGRFAKLDTGSIDNMDGSASPVIAGVPLRIVADAVENAGTIDNTVTDVVNYVRNGLVTVDVKTGETPALFGRVYVSNAGDANDGAATATATDVITNAIFIREVKTDVWLVLLGESASANAGDVALVAEADTAGVTWDASSETLLNECKAQINALIAALQLA